MAKWIENVNCGNHEYYVCPNCGYGDDESNHWKSPYCPVCGEHLKEDEEEGFKIKDDVPLICLEYDCIHNYNCGLCRKEECVNLTEPFCKFREYAKPNPEDFYRSIERAK